MSQEEQLDTGCDCAAWCATLPKMDKELLTSWTPSHHVFEEMLHLHVTYRIETVLQTLQAHLDENKRHN